MSLIHINPKITDAVTQSLGGYYSYTEWPPSMVTQRRSTFRDSTEYEGPTQYGYKIIVSIPGCLKENVSVKYIPSENFVDIDAKSEVEDLKRHYERSYEIPNKFNLDEMQCSLKNGLLTIFVPNGKNSKPKEVKIT
jgi:HSP20 family molecular chaperone IbpA